MQSFEEAKAAQEQTAFYSANALSALLSAGGPSISGTETLTESLSSPCRSWIQSEVSSRFAICRQRGGRDVEACIFLHVVLWTDCEGRRSLVGSIVVTRV